jgi:CheY-like chemotaxis protein
MMSESLFVLVVDDSPSMATTLVDILNIKGFEVYAAQSGAEALEILREHAVDILLTDVIMPDMNGVELYREARKIRSNLTTILMTAYAADDIIRQGMAEGIRTVLNKPLNIDFLLTLLSVTMGFIAKED